LYDRIKANFENISQLDAREFCLRCPICVQYTAAPKDPHIQPILSTYPMERIVMDLKDFSRLVEFNDGYCYSNTFIDHFSCFPWVYCTRTKLPDEVLKNLDNLFDNFGICDILQSDNGGEFTADRVNEYLQHLNIKFVHGKPRTPREQGKVEKFNGTQSLSRSFASLHCQI